MRLSGILAVLVLASLPAGAGLLTGQGVAVLDATGAQRTTFSTNETIGFTVVVNNGVASANRLSFQFAVVAPNGNVVFRHVGNSVRGTAGTASSSITGVAIKGFFHGPGTYTLKATASLDGAVNEQDASFAISTPNLLLIYPPNGAVNITDNPLTFHWYSSGASSYRVTVGDNPSLYNALFTETTQPGVDSLTYPTNPTDARQRLSTGQVYYWSVVGLDTDGNVVAQSPIPFSFSVAKTSLARDMAVTALTVAGTPDSSGAIPFQITVANQGNTVETNTPLRVTVGGVSAPNTPVTLPQLASGETKTLTVAAPIPADMNSTLAIACLTLFDDNVSNNCMTLSVNRPPPASSSTLAGATAESMTPAQIWQSIQQILQERGIDLSQYSLIDMEGTMTKAQLLALLDQLRQGTAQATLTGPSASGSADPAQFAIPEFSTGTAPAPTTGTPAAPAAPAESVAASTPTPSSSISAEPASLPQEQSWSGEAKPMGAKTVTLAVKNESIWQRIWRRLSAEPPPIVDFAQHMVVAISVGSEDPGDRIDIAEYKTEGDTLVVRYRIAAVARPFEAARAPGPKASTHFYLGVIPRTSLKVRFERLKED